MKKQMKKQEDVEVEEQMTAVPYRHLLRLSEFDEPSNGEIVW